MKTDCLSGGDQPFVIETSRRKALLSTVVEIRAHMQSHEKRLQRTNSRLATDARPGAQCGNPDAQLDRPMTFGLVARRSRPDQGILEIQQ